jgi:uncharacterized protein YutE (UPF0331/DUF86 family)
VVISNLNIKLIEDRLGFINGALARLKRFSLLEEEEFLLNDNPAIAESYLRRSLEAVFDIGRHIISKTAGKGIIEYREIAKALGGNGIVSRKCSDTLILMAGYRNRLIHFYHEIGEKELYSIIKGNLYDIEVFVKEIAAFIRDFEKRPK